MAGRVRLTAGRAQRTATRSVARAYGRIARSPAAFIAGPFRQVPADLLLLGEDGDQTDDLMRASTPLPAWPADVASSTAAVPHVRPVRHSDCYVVVDGHEQLRAAYAQGQTALRVRVGRVPAWTPLQEQLLGMHWLEGRRELYQPVDAPEITRGDWVLVRQCADRFALMHEFLRERKLLPPRTTTYLDVGASYGWFVARMQQLGFDAHGIELDARAPRLAESLYGVPADHIHVGDCAETLRTYPPADVVSCLSVMHHFALGRGSCNADEFLDRLAAVTRRVLFFDTGESHEVWLRRQLPDWTAESIQAWLAAHPAFGEVVPLGTDNDDTGRFAGNYGRTLFACVRR
jgi:hypothetical protein